MLSLVPLILSGGTGSRLWPASREALPKQLLPLINPQKTMLQETCERAQYCLPGSKPIIIANQVHRFLVQEQLAAIQADAEIILEPVGRNTAPAIAVGALKALEQHDDPYLLVMPADHVISNQSEFKKAVDQGYQIAQQGFLVTFGIVPTHPATGYGYIRKGHLLNTAIHGYKVNEFVEKPDESHAKHYIESGEYLWNSGIFFLSARLYLQELEKFAPDILPFCETAMRVGSNDLGLFCLNKEAMAQCPANSIDYCVMEKTTQSVVVPLDCGWSDVGSWESLWDCVEKNDQQNCVKGDVIAIDTRHSYVSAESRTVGVIGMEDCIVVETPDAVLIADKKQSQKVKQLVSELKQKSKEVVTCHQKVYRPWGWYRTITEAKQHKVKEIYIKPGAALSLQSHQHRSEHWVVVKGTATVVCGEEVSKLSKDQSTYIPCGVRHRLKNETAEDLYIIEVQSGDYLGEDDIVRYEDIYGR